MTSLGTALSAGMLVLDGGLATELERRGHDLSSDLWSARLLTDDPGEIVGVHESFLAAGAQVITTASYQASAQGFARAGFAPDEARRLIQLSVELARHAIERSAGRAIEQAAGQPAEHASGRTRSPVWVAGSAGPYGAMLADGSEYTGAYPAGIGVRELRAFHRPQLTMLSEAGADVVACETIPSLDETAAVIAELQQLGQPGWVSLTTVAGPDGQVRTRRGELAHDAFALAADVDQVLAVGVNCTSPDGVAAAVRVAAQASGKPVVVYPNSGETWDAAARTWTGTPVDDAAASAADGAAFTTEQVSDWREAGARMVGGCCRVGPGAIAAITRSLR